LQLEGRGRPSPPGSASVFRGKPMLEQVVGRAPADAQHCPRAALGHRALLAGIRRRGAAADDARFEAACLGSNSVGHQPSQARRLAARRIGRGAQGGGEGHSRGAGAKGGALEWHGRPREAASGSGEAPRVGRSRRGRPGVPQWFSGRRRIGRGAANNAGRGSSTDAVEGGGRASRCSRAPLCTHSAAL
jgi:hypothetical protein